MRLIPLGVSVIVAALVFAGLGDAPFIDPPEGFHAVVAHTMSARGDFVTPRFDGVRSFDTPPLLYWLLSTAFALGGPTAAAARYWPALSGVAVATLTAATGVLIGGARVGLLAGLMVAANLGIFLHARLVEPDVLFIAFVTLAYAGFAAAYLGRGGRRGLAVFYAGLALAAITKDVVLAVGAVVAVGVFLFITRERPLGPWVPWWGIAVLAALPVAWYFAVERRNHGFVWYTVVDGHVLRYLHDRHFPDGHASVPTLDFLVATVVAFLPWSLAAPWAIARSFRRPWRTATDRLWVLFAVWAVHADFLHGVAVQARSRRSAGVPSPRASRRAGVGRHAGGRATRAPVPNAPDADLRGGRRRRHHRDARLARGHRRASTAAPVARRGHAQPRPAGPGVAARIAGARIGARLLERDLRVCRHRARRGGVARMDRAGHHGSAGRDAGVPARRGQGDGGLCAGAVDDADRRSAPSPSSRLRPARARRCHRAERLGRARARPANHDRQRARLDARLRRHLRRGARRVLGRRPAPRRLG
ncbi:MAG: hypothetical protein DME08_01985 [Candidatus Rokuibacteriota bacterium]|nr:MAG: hypothetical protein DME08_01985 [Candidatus Rokubacteria bacterium]